MNFSNFFAYLSPRIATFFKGMGIGAANLVPGVSGGTLALILNVYEQLIEAIHNISLGTLWTILRLLTFKKTAWEAFKEEMKRIDAGFIMIILLGVLASIFAFAGLMTYLISNYHDPINGFFFGLILLSILVPYAMIKKKDFKVWVTIFLAVVMIVFLSFLTTGEETIEKEQAKIEMEETAGAESAGGLESIVDYAVLFLSGALAISAMALPGVSGSLIMLLMGKYFVLLQAVNDRNLLILLVFVLGTLFGIILFTRVINFMLRKFHDLTMGFLTGLVAGSLWAIWPFKNTFTLTNGEKIYLSNKLPTDFGANEVLVLIAVVLGGGLVMGMMIISKRQKARRAAEE